MHVHDAYGLALLVVRGRDEESEIQSGRDQDPGQPRAPRQKRIGEAEETAGIGEAVHGLRPGNAGSTPGR